MATKGDGEGREGLCVGELELEGSNGDETKSPAKIDPFYNVSAATWLAHSPLLGPPLSLQDTELINRILTENNPRKKDGAISETRNLATYLPYREQLR